MSWRTQNKQETASVPTRGASSSQNRWREAANSEEPTFKNWESQDMKKFKN